MVGNDIVDLHFADRPSHQHIGHPQRVCTTEELAYIREAESPSVTLAALWACKEATYKLFSKKACFPFVPKQFVVRFDNPGRLTDSKTALVSYSGIPARIELSVTEKWVHAASISQAARIVRWKVREIETASRTGLLPHDESEAVRLLAAELISVYCQGNIRIGFQGRVPILTNEADGHIPIEICFSHHGKFAAVAIAWPNDGRERLSQSHGFAGNTTPWEGTCSTCTA